MALADYYLCDQCKSKVFYDAGIDWHYQHVGEMKAICVDCAERFSVVIIAKDLLRALDDILKRQEDKR